MSLNFSGNKLSANPQKVSQKKLSKTTTGCSSSTNKSTPGEEMKNIMMEWHKPVYHRSSFSMSTDMVTNTGPSEPKDENRTMCRICQSMEDSMTNQQVTPCGCSGSLQYVHINCLRQWRLTQKAKGMEVSHCELCKKPYNVQLLGSSDVPTDNLLKLQEDLKQLVRSGIYLMLLVKSWKKDLVDLHLQRQMERDEDTSSSSISSGSLSSTLLSDAEASAPAGQSTLQETITSRLSVLNNLSEAPKDSNSHSASETSTYLARPNRMQSFVDSGSSSDEDAEISDFRESLKRKSTRAFSRRKK